jgi:hypothetical protein
MLWKRKESFRGFAGEGGWDSLLKKGFQGKADS